MYSYLRIYDNERGGGCTAALVTDSKDTHYFYAEALGDLMISIGARYPGMSLMMDNDTALDLDAMGVTYTRVRDLPREYDNFATLAREYAAVLAEREEAKRDARIKGEIIDNLRRSGHSLLNQRDIDRRDVASLSAALATAQQAAAEQERENQELRAALTPFVRAGEQIIQDRADGTKILFVSCTIGAGACVTADALVAAARAALTARTGEEGT